MKLVQGLIEDTDGREHFLKVKLGLTVFESHLKCDHNNMCKRTRLYVDSTDLFFFFFFFSHVAECVSCGVRP